MIESAWCTSVGSMMYVKTLSRAKNTLMMFKVELIDPTVDAGSDPYHATEKGIARFMYAISVTTVTMTLYVW